MVAEKLSEALQMSALLLDADGAGYFGFEDGIAVQKADVDFRLMCQSIALHLLRKSPQSSNAKIILASQLARLKTSIAQCGYENDDAAMFSYLEDHITQAIDREGSKSAIMREISRFILLLPRIFRWLVLTLFGGGMIFAVADIVRTK